jgi:hypothetical protein
MQNPPSRTRVRIYSHVTQSRFLHLEDALEIGKIRLFAGTYRRGQGMESHSYHFIDLADARVVFDALAGAEAGFSYREYKGTPTETGAVSRILSVQVRGENVYVELKTGPGKLTPTGAITPSGKPRVEINVGFKLYEARRMAAAILAYIHAWDVHRLMAQHFVLDHQQLISQPAPHLLVATEAAGTSVPADEDSDQGQEALTAGFQAETRNGDRPVTRKSRANGGPALAPARPAVPPHVEATAESIYGPGGLRYGDGSAVDAGNLVEVQAFQRFVAEKKNAPASRTILQAYYREHMTA